MEKIRIFCGQCNEELAKQVLSWIIPGETGVTTEINLEVDPVDHKCVNERKQKEDDMEKWYLVETADGAKIGFGSPNSEAGLRFTGGERVHQIACAQYIIRLHEKEEEKLMTEITDGGMFDDLKRCGISVDYYNAQKEPKSRKRRKSRKHWKREAKRLDEELYDVYYERGNVMEELLATKELLAKRDGQLFDMESKQEAGYDKAIEELRATRSQLVERDDQLRDQRNDLDVLKHQLEMAEQSKFLHTRSFLIAQEQLQKIRRIYNDWIGGNSPELIDTVGRMLDIFGILETPQPAPEPRDESNQDQDQETESKSNIVLLCQSAKFLKIRSIYETWEKYAPKATHVAFATLAYMTEIGDVLKGDPKDYVDMNDEEPA